MPWWYILAIIGVVVAGIGCGLAISYLIIRIQKKRSLSSSGNQVPAVEGVRSEEYKPPVERDSVTPRRIVLACPLAGSRDFLPP
jgi:hypothetical protein